MTEGDSRADFPYWARRLIEDRTPYLAADPDIRVLLATERRVKFYSRGFVYVADYDRQQVI